MIFPVKTFYRSSALILTLASVCLMASPVLAGFEWVPAQESNAVNQDREDWIATQEASTPQVLVPMEKIVEEDYEWKTVAPIPQEQAPLPVPTKEVKESFTGILATDKTPEEKSWETQTVSEKKFAPPIQPQSGVQVGKKPVVPSNITYDVIEGFGSEMPLALAMRQVIPAQYSFSFGPDVNAGTKVSWNGGKPWDIVLQDMVASADMRSQIIGNTVRLEKGKMSRKDIEKPAKPIQLVKTSRRQNIQDPGMGVVEETSYEDLPPLTQTTPSVPTTISTNNSLLPMEMDDIISPSKPETVATTMVDTQKDLNQPRMRMSEKIQQDITRENIELRMNTDNSENFNSFNDTVSSQPQTQRPYSIDPYTPPGYMQDTSVSEKNAYMDNGFRTGNQLKAAQQDQVWEASRGDGLKETLVQWAKKSNINLVWSAKRDYALSSNVWVNGDFRDALTAVVNDGLPTNNKPQIKLVDTPSDSKSTTFVVSDRG